MPIQFNIAVTKEIIKLCKNCGNELNVAEKNCAVALALVDIFPDVYVTNYHIFPLGINCEKTKKIKISLPLIAQQFIKLFDGFSFTPNLRLLLPAFDFIVEIPDELIEQINIDEVKQLISAGNETVNI